MLIPHRCESTRLLQEHREALVRLVQQEQDQARHRLRLGVRGRGRGDAEDAEPTECRKNHSESKRQTQAEGNEELNATRYCIRVWLNWCEQTEKSVEVGASEQSAAAADAGRSQVLRERTQ